MNISLSIIELLLILIIFKLVLFSVFLVFRKGNSENSHLFLGLFFLALAINIFHSLTLRLSDFFLFHMPHIFYIGSPFAFIYAPSFYFYILKITSNKKELKAKDLIHLIPFVVLATYLIISFYFLPLSDKIERIQTNSVIRYPHYLMFMSVLHIQILFYVTTGIKELRRFQLRIREVYSDVNHLNFSWIKFVFICVLLLWLADVSRFLTIFMNPRIYYLIEAGLFITFLTLCYTILYRAINQPMIFTIDNSKNKKNSLSTNSTERYLEKLLRYMENEKPYKDPDISIMELAEKVGIPHRSLSEVINSALEKNFYDFINGYRVKESERLLSETKTYKTVLEVIYEVGFNSKSSFHSAFKKNTGMTPTQFKRLHTVQ